MAWNWNYFSTQVFQVFCLIEGDVFTMLSVSQLGFLISYWQTIIKRMSKYKKPPPTDVVDSVACLAASYCLVVYCLHCVVKRKSIDPMGWWKHQLYFMPPGGGMMLAELFLLLVGQKGNTSNRKNNWERKKTTTIKVCRETPSIIDDHDRMLFITFYQHSNEQLSCLAVLGSPDLLCVLVPDFLSCKNDYLLN